MGWGVRLDGYCGWGFRVVLALKNCGILILVDIANNSLRMRGQKFQGLRFRAYRPGGATVEASRF